MQDNFYRWNPAPVVLLNPAMTGLQFIPALPPTPDLPPHNVSGGTANASDELVDRGPKEIPMKNRTSQDRNQRSSQQGGAGGNERQQFQQDEGFGRQAGEGGHDNSGQQNQQSSDYGRQAGEDDDRNRRSDRNRRDNC